MHILDSLFVFSTYFFVGVVMVIIFLFVCFKITPHNEWQLIKNSNTAAPLAFSGILLSCVIPLSDAATNTVSTSDYFAQGGIVLVIQLLAFAGIRLYMPALSEKIINHSTAAGVFIGTAALAGSILNVACMTWQWAIMARKRKSRNSSKIGHGAISCIGRPHNPLEPRHNRYTRRCLMLVLMGGTVSLIAKGWNESSDVNNDGDGTFYSTMQDCIDDSDNVDICARGWNNAKTTFYADAPKNTTQQNCQSKYESCYYGSVERNQVPVTSGFLLSWVVRGDRDEQLVYNSGGSSFASHPVRHNTSGDYS